MAPIHPVTSGAITAPEIISVGQATIDTVHIEGRVPSVHIGGSAYIPARILAENGIRVGLVCCLGDDLAVSDLQVTNLDLRGVTGVPGPSTSVELHYSKQHLVALKVSPGASEKLDISQIPPDYFDAKL